MGDDRDQEVPPGDHQRERVHQGDARVQEHQGQLGEGVDVQRTEGEAADQHACPHRHPAPCPLHEGLAEHELLGQRPQQRHRDHEDQGRHLIGEDGDVGVVRARLGHPSERGEQHGRDDRGDLGRQHGGNDQHARADRPLPGERPAAGDRVPEHPDAQARQQHVPEDPGPRARPGTCVEGLEEAAGDDQERDVQGEEQQLTSIEAPRRVGWDRALQRCGGRCGCVHASDARRDALRESCGEAGAR